VTIRLTRRLASAARIARRAGSGMARYRAATHSVRQGVSSRRRRLYRQRSAPPAMHSIGRRENDAR